jgi:hypothetical protein
LALSSNKREFLDEELFEEIIKGDWSVPCVDPINDCSVTVIKAAQNMVGHVLDGDSRSERGEEISSLLQRVHVGRDGLSTFRGHPKTFLELLKVTAGGFGIGVLEKLPEVVRGPRLGHQGGHLVGQSGEYGTIDEAILASPCLMSRVW